MRSNWPYLQNKYKNENLSFFPIENSNQNNSQLNKMILNLHEIHKDRIWNQEIKLNWILFIKSVYSSKLKVISISELIKAGRSKEAGLIKGDIMNSSIAKRILMHIEEDGVMPPEDEKELTYTEKLKILDWIKNFEMQNASEVERN